MILDLPGDTEFDTDRRVRAGARLLDERVSDWRQRVLPSTLDLYSPCSCVLGQVFDDYVTGVAALGVFGKTNHLGFDCNSEAENAALVHAWRAELERDAA